jgi:uncharacterized repeat protein (TIGR03803 family)
MSNDASSTMARLRATLLASVAAATLAVAPGAQAYTLLHKFHLATDGQLPRAKLLYVTCGTSHYVFGTTQYGGTSGRGTVFSYALPAGPETVIHSFTGLPTDGGEPAAGLIQVGGNLYGTTLTGGTSGMGTVYSIPVGTCNTPQTPTVIHSFLGSPSDAQTPAASLLYYGGYLWGTSVLGSIGSANLGTVFLCRPTLTGPCKVIHSFAGSPGDGAYPYAALIEGAVDINGVRRKALVGTTEIGGTSGLGTIFGLQGSSETVLYNFAGGPTDGAYPLAEMLQHGQDLYTTTAEGGTGPCTGGCGTVFRYPVGVSYNFLGGADGATPVAGLVWDSVTHKFYGTTYAGGFGGCTGGCGTAFKANGLGVELGVPFSFTNVGTKGMGPAAGLILDSNTLYGTTSAGPGTLNNGTVFSFP